MSLALYHSRLRASDALDRHPTDGSDVSGEKHESNQVKHKHHQRCI